jgi:shikimate dehydrogenase
VTPVRLAVLGDPLRFTMSPVLHRAGLDALGLEGESVALRTAADALGARLAELAAAGYLGANLTHPLKEAVIGHLERVAAPARRARSVNTVGFSAGGAWGETTDGPGFLDLLESLGRDPGRERAVLLGAGGAARSLALALHERGAQLRVWARRPEDARGSWSDLEAVTLEPWGSPGALDGLARSTLVVNATPLSADSEPLPPARLPGSALAIDLTYGPELSPWARAARAARREALDGLGLLVHQARRSLALWFGRQVPLEPLARAVGWPR